MDKFAISISRVIARQYADALYKWCGYQTLKKIEDMFIRFDRIHERDGQTDRQTDRIAISIWRVNIAALTREKTERRAVSL